VELNQEDTDAWYFIGFIHNKTKNFLEAINALSKVISIESQAGDAYYQRGIAYFNILKDEEACADWSEGLLIGNEMCKQLYEAECVQ
jgi:tetratricopeptide (TPR) repeat protein